MQLDPRRLAARLSAALLAAGLILAASAPVRADDTEVSSLRSSDSNSDGELDRSNLRVDSQSRDDRSRHDTEEGERALRRILGEAPPSRPPVTPPPVFPPAPEPLAQP